MRRSYVVFILVACVGVAALSALPEIRRTVTYMREDVELSLHPSAKTAFEYGNLHFSSPKHPESYDVKRAKKLYLKTIALDPNHPTAYVQLARTHFISGRKGESLLLLQTQLARNPEATPSLYYMLALVYGYMDRYEEAADAYREYIVRVPDSAAAFNDLAWVLIKEGKSEEALSATDKGLAILPQSPWLLLSRAVALYELGRYEEARPVALQAVEASKKITVPEWALMYPGNDPSTIDRGIRTLQDASVADLAKIEAALASTTLTAER